MTQLFLNGITLDELKEAVREVLLSSRPEPKQSENDLLTRAEVCKLLSISKPTLWKYTKTGKLKSKGIGNRVYYDKNEVLNAVIEINQK